MPSECQCTICKRKTGSVGQSLKKVCGICGKTVSRVSDLGRHLRTHNPTAKKLPCPWEGCGFKTFQRRDLMTHYRGHTRILICIDDSDSGTCTFRTCDPASLLRHRKHFHNY